MLDTPTFEVKRILALALLSTALGTAQPTIQSGTLHGRNAWILENGIIRVAALQGGGHIGEIRFLTGDAKRTLSPFYVPAYQTIEPYEYDPAKHRSQYGSALGSGYMGHLLCFPHFGPASPDETKRGLGGHGEAAVVEWKQSKPPQADERAITLYYGAELPKTQYRVERSITLLANETVIYVEETFENLATFDRPYNRDGHATFGTPFVEPGKNFFDTSGERGLIQVRPNHSLLSGREIRWPEGLGPNGRPVDLRGVQPIPKTNTLYAVSLPSSRALNYFTLYNTEYPILVGFLLPASDHNWVVDWQNNQGDRFMRGIEFGTSPFDEGRPIGNLLFLGPTGSGKTRIVEATAEALVDNPAAVIKIDCAEFQHGHEIAKLIGSPPGYLGHRETHPLLSQEVLGRYHTDTCKISFVLFDEIEKASDTLWNLLLGILDKGTLTLGDNRKVDFSRAMIFMTSNLGAAEMNALMAPRLGFSAVQHKAEQANERSAALDNKIEKSGVEAARRKFTPEFMNRLDNVVVFRPLGESELKKIVEIELSMVQQRIFTSSPDRPFIFDLTEPAKTHLIGQGTDMKYGARHLKRAVERLLVQPMSNLVASGQVRAGDWLRVDFSSDSKQLIFLKKNEGLPMQAMRRMADASLTSAQAPSSRAPLFIMPHVQSLIAG